MSGDVRFLRSFRPAKLWHLHLLFLLLVEGRALLFGGIFHGSTQVTGHVEVIFGRLSCCSSKAALSAGHRPREHRAPAATSFEKCLEKKLKRFCGVPLGERKFLSCGGFCASSWKAPD